MRDIKAKSIYDLNTVHEFERMILSTGFSIKGQDIYDGDLLHEIVETDEGPIESVRQVFWCPNTGAWMIDDSFDQDKSFGSLLSVELENFELTKVGSIHRKIKKS